MGYVFITGNRLVGAKPGDWILEIWMPRESKARKLPKGWLPLHKKALGGRSRLRSLGFSFSFPPMDVDSGLEAMARLNDCGRKLRLRSRLDGTIIPGYMMTR
jgi:hypothetical protein